MVSWLAIQSTWKAKNGPFTVLGWLTRAHTQQCACDRFLTRVYHATAQGHSAVQANRCHRRSSIVCRLAALPNQRAVTDRRASACGQTTTTHAAELSSARTLR